jgi:hypothetical protein
MCLSRSNLLTLGFAPNAFLLNLQAKWKLHPHCKHRSGRLFAKREMARFMVNTCGCVESSEAPMESWTRSQWQKSIRDLDKIQEILLRPDSTKYQHEPQEHDDLPRLLTERLGQSTNSVSGLVSTFEACAAIAPVRDYLWSWATWQGGSPIEPSAMRRVM